MEESILSYTIEDLRSSGSGTKDFDFFRLEVFAKDIDYLKAPHRHQFYTFILITGGSGNHAIDFHNCVLKPGRLVMIAPEQVHAWNELKDVKGFMVLFNDSFIALARGRKLVSDWPLFRANQKSYFDLSDADFSIWVDEFLHIENEMKEKDEFSRDSLFYSIGSLLVRAARLSKVTKPNLSQLNSDFLYSFQELIDENFLTLKMPKDYAFKLNVTANYLNALCKKKSGKSAGELIRQRVLLEAKRLLAHTQLSASEIAFNLGFSDNSYFGRYFSKYTGETPATFRKRQQK